jgi:two-component sensor histidine kinase
MNKFSRFHFLFISVAILLLLPMQGNTQQIKPDEVQALRSRIDKLDTLIMLQSDYQKAGREAQELQELFAHRYTHEDYVSLKIKTMLLQATLFSFNGVHHQALKIALAALDESNTHDLPEMAYHSCIVLAIMHELSRELDKCRTYLDEAYKLYERHALDSIYSVYCIRNSSYYRLSDELDSARVYAQEGLKYALKYNNHRERRDAYLLLGALVVKDDYNKAVEYKSLAAQEFVMIKDYGSAASQLAGAGLILARNDRVEDAWMYNDSALVLLKQDNSEDYIYVFSARAQLFDKIGNRDSAYYYFQKYHEGYIKELKRMEGTKMKAVSEQYQSDKKEAIIKGKNQLIIFIVTLFGLVLSASFLIYRKNRRIAAQNKIISRQLDQLIKALDQKQVLLSELQHRVKNNLQHLISLLDIQKESVNYNNIEELIRANQNRVHSMALLHSKLNEVESLNEVDLNKYVTDLAELVKESYDTNDQNIKLDIKCDIEIMSLEKALPIGLIIVELISNSMKHAFEGKGLGVIIIAITRDEKTGGGRITYMDNGKGFDFHGTDSRGVGLEIIKGLIDQINGQYKSNGTDGFFLSIEFNT